VLALSSVRDRRIGKCLQFHDGRSPIDAPEVDDLATAGNPTRQGQHLCLGGGMVLGQLDLQRDLVTTKLCGFLVEHGRFCAGGNQLAAQFAIATLQHLKESNVLKPFGMEFFPGPPGIGGLLGHQRGSGNPDFTPGEGTSQETAGDGYDESGAGHPGPTKSRGNCDDG
jgi:hypothetical protein